MFMFACMYVCMYVCMYLSVLYIPTVYCMSAVIDTYMHASTLAYILTYILNTYVIIVVKEEIWLPNKNICTCPLTPYEQRYCVLVCPSDRQIWVPDINYL